MVSCSFLHHPQVTILRKRVYGGKVWSAGSRYKGVVILTALKLHGRHLIFFPYIFLFHNFFVFVFIRHFILFILDSKLKHLILSLIIVKQVIFDLFSCSGYFSSVGMTVHFEHLWTEWGRLVYHSHSRPRVVSALRGSPRCRSRSTQVLLLFPMEGGSSYNQWGRHNIDVDISC